METLILWIFVWIEMQKQNIPQAYIPPTPLENQPSNALLLK